MHESIFDEFKAAVIQATEKLKVGEGNEPDVFLGPIQNSMQYEKVKGFFQDVKDNNYNIAYGGENPSGDGYFINPTIIDRPAEDSRLVVEEPFGKSCSKTVLLYRAARYGVVNTPMITTVVYRSHCPPHEFQHG